MALQPTYTTDHLVVISCHSPVSDVVSQDVLLGLAGSVLAAAVVQTTEELVAEPVRAAREEPARLHLLRERGGAGGALLAHAAAPAQDEEEADERAAEGHEQDLPPRERATAAARGRSRRRWADVLRCVVDEGRGDEGGYNCPPFNKAQLYIYYIETVIQAISYYLSADFFHLFHTS